MSASSCLYVAATGGASSSLFNPKLSPPFSLPQFLTSQFQLKPKWNLKPLNFKTQNTIFHCLSASSDSFQLTEDEEDSNEEEYPESEEIDELGQEKEEKQKKKGPQKRRLYVGNLPFSTTTSDLSEIFSEAGGITSVQVVYNRVTDRSRGFGFVTMESSEEAQEAIRLFDGSQIGGRTVRVNFPEVPRGGEREVMLPKIKKGYKNFVESPYNIYAGNLSWNVTSDSLGNAFAGQKGFLSAKVVYERETGRSRGFGFVSFESVEDIEAAIAAMNGMEFEGRPLRLNVANERVASAGEAESSANSELVISSAAS